MNPANLQQDTFTKQTLFSAPAIEDTFDYSVTQVQGLDSNGDGALNLTEYASAMGLAPDTFQRPSLAPQEQLMAQQVVNHFKTLDRNQNGYLEVPEAAAYAMFQDDGTTILRRTLRQTGQSQAADHLEAIAQQLQPENFANTPVIADGQITPTEQAISELAVTSMPTYTGQILDGMLSTSPLNLSAHYQLYAQRRASFQQPSALS